MSEDSRTYYAELAKTERERAGRAKSEKDSNHHLMLAARYEALSHGACIDKETGENIPARLQERRSPPANDV